jgi:hypothetical protein
MVGLLILAFVVAAVFPLGRHTALVQVEIYLLLAYSAVRAGHSLRHDPPRIATTVFWLFVFGLFGVVELVQLSIGDNPFHIAYPDSLVEEQVAMVLVGCVAFDFAATLTARRRTSANEVAAAPRRELSLRRITLLSWATVLVSPVLASHQGGIKALFSSRLDVSLALSGGILGGTVSTTDYILRAFANVAPLLCLFGLIRLRQAGEYRFTERLDLCVLFLALLALNIVFNNPVSQTRYWIATVGFTALLAGRWVLHGLFRFGFVAFFLVAMLVIFPYADLFRTQQFGEAQLETRGIVQTYQYKVDYGTPWDITNALMYVHDRGYTDGYQTVGAALFFVPRSVWQSKPSDTASLLATEINHWQNLNLDCPLWAEGYIDLGIVGTIALLALLGFAIGHADRAYRPGRNLGGLASILVPALAGYELILLRGSLLQATGRLAMLLVVGFLISRSRQRSET